MNILIVGSWQWYNYEEAFSIGLKFNNVTVSKFSTSKFFKGNFGHYQLAYPLPGIALLRLNVELLRVAKKVKPDWVFFWRTTHILPITIFSLQKSGFKTVSYNNDDPFGPKVHGIVPWHHHYLWFWYLRSLRAYNINFFYRKVNCFEALSFGAKNAHLLLPYFIPWKDRPIQLTPQDLIKYKTDVVFIGHYEPDGRVDSIKSIIEAGISVKIWGGSYWSREILGELYDKLKPIKKAENEIYTKALCGAKICLAFLSKMNRDTYTRRCFEIPACGRIMLAERTSDLQSLFKEDEEACYFSSNEELISKVKWLLSNSDIRERIANAGLRRVWSDGNDVYTRTKEFLSILEPSKIS